MSFSWKRGITTRPPEANGFSKPGDVNGDSTVDLTDVILALQIAAGLEPDEITLGGDANGDGELNIAEAIMVLKKIGQKHSEQVNDYNNQGYSDYSEGAKRVKSQQFARHHHKIIPR